MLDINYIKENPAEVIERLAIKGKDVKEEIELIASLYSSLLTSKFTDDRYMINAAAEIIAEKKLFSGKTVVLDEFSGFTAQQNLILAEILKQADDVYVTQCADSIKGYSEGTGAFSYAVENINRIISLAKKCDVRVAEPVILKNTANRNSEAISYLEKGFYEPAPDIFEGAAPEITVAAARNLYEECEFAAMSAKMTAPTAAAVEIPCAAQLIQPGSVEIYFSSLERHSG